MFSQARLEMETPISLFLVTSLVILRLSHDPYAYSIIPMPIPLSLCLFHYPYAYSFHPYVLLSLPFTSLPFPTIFSYQLICLAGTAVPSHRDFPGICS